MGQAQMDFFFFGGGGTPAHLGLQGSGGEGWRTWSKLLIALWKKLCQPLQMTKENQFWKWKTWAKFQSWWIQIDDVHTNKKIHILQQILPYEPIAFQLPYFPTRGLHLWTNTLIPAIPFRLLHPLQYSIT